MSDSPHRTIKQFCEEHNAYTPGGMRWLVFNEDTNGLKEEGAVLRINGKVIIHVPRFFQWVDKQNGIIKHSNTQAA